MNRSYILIGAAVVAVIIGGVFVGQKLKKRNLPNGSIVQTSPTPTSGPVTSPIPGKPQVRVNTSQGEVTIELLPDIDNLAVAQLLAKISRGECDNRTASECGLVDKNYVQVISGQLTPDAKISSTFILSK